MARWKKRKKMWPTDRDTYTHGTGERELIVTTVSEGGPWYYYGKCIGNSLWVPQTFKTKELAQDAAIAKRKSIYGL